MNSHFWLPPTLPSHCRLGSRLAGAQTREVDVRHDEARRHPRHAVVLRVDAWEKWQAMQRHIFLMDFNGDLLIYGDLIGFNGICW